MALATCVSLVCPRKHSYNHVATSVKPCSTQGISRPAALLALEQGTHASAYWPRCICFIPSFQKMMPRTPLGLRLPAHLDSLHPLPVCQVLPHLPHEHLEKHDSTVMPLVGKGTSAPTWRVPPSLQLAGVRAGASQALGLGGCHVSPGALQTLVTYSPRPPSQALNLRLALNDASCSTILFAPSRQAPDLTTCHPADGRPLGPGLLRPHMLVSRAPSGDSVHLHPHIPQALREAPKGRPAQAQMPQAGVNRSSGLTPVERGGP